MSNTNETKPVAMMISFDIVTRNGYWKKYRQINGFLMANGLSRMRVLKSQWVVKTRRSASWWYNQLRPIVGPGDRLLVCPIDTNASVGFLPPQVSMWLGNN